MAFYLVRARPKPERLAELETRLREHAFEPLRPFGRALSAGLRGARWEGKVDGEVEGAARAVWEEEDYCRPPLAEERAAVLDSYFDDISVEPVARDVGWRRIRDLPRLFPTLVHADDVSGDAGRHIVTD